REDTEIFEVSGMGMFVVIETEIYESSPCKEPSKASVISPVRSSVPRWLAFWSGSPFTGRYPASFDRPLGFAEALEEVGGFGREAGTGARVAAVEGDLGESPAAFGDEPARAGGLGQLLAIREELLGHVEPFLAEAHVPEVVEHV